MIKDYRLYLTNMRLYFSEKISQTRAIKEVKNFFPLVRIGNYDSNLNSLEVSFFSREGNGRINNILQKISSKTLSDGSKLIKNVDTLDKILNSEFVISNIPSVEEIKNILDKEH